MEDKDNNDSAFDKIIEMTGNDGPFQKRYNYIYNGAMVIVASMTFMNIILALNLPEHWCHVDGREEHTNYTLDQWKNLTLPSELDVKGILTYSKCKMYNVNWTTIQSSDYENWNSSVREEKFGVVECEKHDFDKQWYKSTIVSEENWVCSKDIYQTNAFALNRIGEVIGTFIFGQLGDRLGRQKIFFLSILVVLIGRMLIIFTTSQPIWFWIASVFGNLCTISLFQSPFVVAMEIAKPDDRANVAVMQSISWTIGTSIMPFIYWYFGEWFPFMILTTVPLGIFLCFPKYFIESPRWLVNRGKLDRAAHYLNRIAKINNKEVIISAKTLQTILPPTEPEKVYGMFSLFSGLRLAKNTIIIVICCMIGTVSYFTLVLYIAQTAGNPFLNFFMQSASEAPAVYLGMWMDTEYEYFATFSTIMVKFWTTIIFFGVHLIAMETYPTCIRQTGLSFGTITSNFIGILGPYVAYLGIKYDRRYPILILCGLFLIGGFSCLFLPETLHQKLPDSMEEARKFGKNQKFWSFPKKVEKEETTEKEKESNEELERLRPVS